MDLKRLRHDYKLSQSDLATIFGCKQANISSLEKGERNLSGLQIRLLIEKYGYDVISRYAEPSELPTTVTVNAPQIKNNTAPVQAGNGNQMTTNDQLIDTVNKLIEQNTKKDEQIDRLISILEKMQS